MKKTIVLIVSIFLFVTSAYGAVVTDSDVTGIGGGVSEGDSPTFGAISTTGSLTVGGNLVANGPSHTLNGITIDTSGLDSGPRIIGIGQSISLVAGVINKPIYIATLGRNSAGVGIDMRTSYVNDITHSSGIYYGLSITGNYATSGTAETVQIYSNISTISEGSGGTNHLRLETDRVQVFNVDKYGTTNIGGGLSVAFRNVSTNNSPVTVAKNDYSFDCNAAAGDVTFNLMSSSLVPGQGFEFSNTGSSGKCKLEAAGSETISGFENYSGLNTQWESVLIRSNGTGWTIKAAY